MQFLLDANIPYSAKLVFATPYHIVTHVRDLNLQHATDDTIAQWAQKQQTALITRD